MTLIFQAFHELFLLEWRLGNMWLFLSIGSQLWNEIAASQARVICPPWLCGGSI